MTINTVSHHAMQGTLPVGTRVVPLMKGASFIDHYAVPGKTVVLTKPVTGIFSSRRNQPYDDYEYYRYLFETPINGYVGFQIHRADLLVIWEERNIFG